ncbi:Prefoldin [Acaromyces ingoldii]|uniref:Prefoldin n=1 Tax=Acaromyces ingoldii TaxID=215250 RepID=A0A316YJV6_9BASI|nr:Prefoldin [Acaromyces ingoldii]PWN89094.1 Prefoldin [Acaromyces ingoldii]
MAPPGIPDEALHKVLQQIQAQVINSSRQLNMVRAQMQGCETARKRCEFTIKQLDDEGDVPMYQGVGKMFIREDKSKIRAEIEKRMKDVVEEIANLAKKQKFLEKQAGDAQAHMRDIFQGLEKQQQQVQAS